MTTVPELPHELRRIASYAVQPEYYGSTFCCHCHGYFPVGPNGEFVWDGSEQKVGTRRTQSSEAP